MAIPYSLAGYDAGSVALSHPLDDFINAKPPKAAAKPAPAASQRASTPTPAPAATTPAVVARAPQREAQQQATRKAAVDRERRQAEAADARAADGPDSGWDERAFDARDGGGQGSGQEGQDGQDGGQGEPDEAAGAHAPGAAACAGADGEAADEAEALAGLLPHGSSSGIFEVLLPDGDTLGVAVDVTPQHVAYLLQPGSDSLAARLRRQQMELGSHLERRIGRSVRLTVL